MAAYRVSQHWSSIAPSKPEAIALKQMDILKLKTPTQPILNADPLWHQKMKCSHKLLPGQPYGRGDHALGRRKVQFPEHKPYHASHALGSSRSWPALYTGIDTDGQTEKWARIQMCEILIEIQHCAHQGRRMGRQEPTICWWTLEINRL